MSIISSPDAARLAEPFDASEVEWKPQAIKGERCLAVCFVDARTVMDRLDAVLGVGGWQNRYRIEANGVICCLRARIGGEWIEHEDAGSFSDQSDDGDKLKAAVSDSLKRAAVHLGVGRYLYRLPLSWVDYDPIKKRIVHPPTLPSWALPGGKRQGEPGPTPPPAPAQHTRPPADGLELEARLRDLDAWSAAKGYTPAGAVIDHVRRKGQEAKLSGQIHQWPASAFQDAQDMARQFVAAARKEGGNGIVS
jgi:Rad52/22 family double-strand break repair protein